MFFYISGNEPKQDGFSLAMHYNKTLILVSWFPMLIFDLMGIYYLDIDHHICAVSPLWIWSLFALVFQVLFFYLIALCTMIKYSYEYHRLHMTIGALVICSFIMISGAVILFSSTPYTCRNMRSSGLYLWSLFAFSVISIALLYYLVRTFVEHDAIRQGKKKTVESDYLLAQLNVGDTEAQIPADDELNREPLPCYRPECNEYGTTLCGTCKQVCYCSSACLFAHHKTVHKFECLKMLSESRGKELGPNNRLLGSLRTSSYVPHDASKEGH